MRNFNTPVGNMKINRHPMFWVSNIIVNSINSGVINNGSLLSFSKYVYKQQAYEDQRYTFNVPYHQLSKDFLLDSLMDLEDDEELALNSPIFDPYFGNNFHIPLIDFGGKESVLLERAFKDFSNYWHMEFRIYNSGRSFHAYGDRLLSHQDWIKFMGSLLLLNLPGGIKIIDDRWVGHRILAGYSALRWSKNTSRYKKYPTHIGYLNANGFVDEFGSSLFPIALNRSY